jgi:hypothetical protein
MEQLVKAGLSARLRGSRVHPAARAALAAAGLMLAAGIAFAAGNGPRDDEHLADGNPPSTWLEAGPLDPALFNGPLSGPMPLTPDNGAAPRLGSPDKAADVRITYRITSGNAIGLTVVNNGLFGNNFSSRSPSFEYPLGSNIDHMPRAGIWVGAVDAVGDTLVSTATIDGSISGSLPIAEFLPIAGTVITERSMLPESRYYDPTARSEQDFFYTAADTSAELGIPSAEPHRPLHVRMETETLLFSFDPFEAIVMVNCKFINIGIDDLRDVRIGFYSELASGWKNPALATWASGWWKKKSLAYVDSSRMVTEHSYNLGDGHATSWAGIKLLGTRPTPIDSCTVSFNWWNWQQDPTLQPNDARRYQLLGNDVRMGPSDSRNDDPVEVVGVSSRPGIPSAFDFFGAGDTLTFSFAFVGGMDDRRVTGRNAREDLLANGHSAQWAYDKNFRIPMPPPSPRINVVPGRNAVTVEWSGAGPELFRDPESGKRDFEGYRIHVSEERSQSGFRRILERDMVDQIGYDTGLADIRDSLIAPARPETVWTNTTPPVIDHFETRPEVWHYSYTIGGLRDGFKYWVAVTAFDRGTVDVGSLESGLGQNLTFAIPGTPASVGGKPKVSVFPNPYRGDAAWDGSLRRDRYLWFTNLPPRCVIRIYTLAGDLVDTIDFDQATYRPTDIRGIFDPTDPRDPERDLPSLPGGMAAWDLVSRKDQGVASGLYLYSVEEPNGGGRQVGKFLIVK